MLLILGGTWRGAEAETISFPNDAVGGTGLEAQVFMSVSGATGFTGVDLHVTIDPTVIVAKKIGKGTLAVANNNDCTIVDDIPEPPDPTQSVIHVVVFCTLPINSDGEFLRFDFDVVGTQDSTSPLDITFCLVDEVPCTPVDGLLTVISQPISGKIVYYNGLDTRPAAVDERPVGAVDVDLFGDVTTSTSTAADGLYTIADVIAVNPNITLQPTKLGEFNIAVTSFDAALVARHVVGLITLNSRQLFAADWTGNGDVSGLDASRIAQFSVGLVAESKMEQNCDTGWAFFPDPAPVANQTSQDPDANADLSCTLGEIAYNPLGGTAPDQDFIAILIGDVSGSWQPAAPPVGTAQSSGESHTAAPARGGAQLRIGKKTAHPGETLTLPIQISRAKDVLGVDVVLTYAPGVLAPLGVTTTALSQNMELLTNLDEPGQVRVSLFGTEALRKGGTLLEVTFAVIGQGGTESPVEIAEALINEIPAATRHGSVRIR
jgi:hypothetical protein